MEAVHTEQHLASEPPAAVVTHPVVFPAVCSALCQPDTRQAADLLLERQAAGEECRGFVEELAQQRGLALAHLKDVNCLNGQGAVAGSVGAYLSRLRALCTDWTDHGDQTSGASSSPPDTIRTPTQVYLLRRSLTFTWQQAWNSHHIPSSSSSAFAFDSSSPSSSMQDAAFEAASLLLACATAAMAKAAALVNTGSGTPTATATQAYKLLRQAAGLLQAVRQQLLVLLTGCTAFDLQPALLLGLELLALADGQGLTLCRAVAKGHSPGLVASLAVDTADLHAAAQKQLLGVLEAAIGPWKGSSSSRGAAAAGGDPVMDVALPPRCQLLLLVKAVAYTRWRYCYCRALSAAHAAAAALEAQQGGAAVAWAAESNRLVKFNYSLGNEFDRCLPASSRSWHEQQDRELDQTVQAMLARCLKDNQGIYLQPVPSKLPPWPQGKRSIEPLPPQLPGPCCQALTPGAAAALVAAAAGRVPPQTPAEEASATTAAAAAAAAGPGGTSGSSGAAGGAAAAAADAAAAAAGNASEASGSKGCSPVRCIVCTLAYPLLLLVSLVGCLVWLLLLPLKLCCCCCPLACLLQLTWDVVEYAVKAPLRAALWAAGSYDWRPPPRQQQQQQDDKHTSSRGGDIEAPAAAAVPP